MGLRIVRVDDRDCPRVFCDWCQQEIASHDEGNYQWAMAVGGELPPVTEMYFTHKECCYAFERAHAGTFWGAMPLDVLVFYLSTNLEVAWPSARRHALTLNGDETETATPRPDHATWKRLRQKVLERDGKICVYCGRYANAPHCDHVVPLGLGGENILSNLVTSCPKCNHAKHMGAIAG